VRKGSVLLAVLTVLLLSGCRIKSWESFESATTPNEPGTWKGDEYALAGTANATGGQNIKTRYSEGAKNGQTQGLTTTYGEAGKGTGLQPGEPTVANRAGHGNQNAPAFQETPGNLGSPASKSGR
jgi:hypothetical protein